LYVNSSTFTDNTAIYGGAICGAGTSIVHFNRFVGNNAQSGNAVYGNGNFDARLNWWGTNTDPSGDEYYATVTPWLVLKATVNPLNSDDGGNSLINAYLLYDSNGLYHDPINGHVPDGIPVYFTVTNGNINPEVSKVFDGLAEALFTSNNSQSSIKLRIDNQYLLIQPTALNNTNISNNDSSTSEYSYINTMQTDNGKNIPMQPTGIPIIPLLIGSLMIIAGLSKQF
jgi:autotransporter family porin